jgi:alpha-1,2-mannosyltransferase
MFSARIQIAADRLSACASRSPRTSAAVVACAIVTAAAFVHLVLALFHQQSGAWILRDLFKGHLPVGVDSWSVMLAALDWMDTHPNADGSLYTHLFFNEQQKFQYAPTSLLPLDALRMMGLELSPHLLNSLNRLVLIASSLGLGVLCWVLPERLAAGPLDADARQARLWMTATAPVAALLFFPLTYGYHIGQLQVMINALFILACIAWVCERRAAAGILIGLICILKPQFGLFLIWGALRKEWRFTVALLATGTSCLLLSVIMYGFGNHLGYLEVLSFLSRHGEAFWANQSVNGLLHRIFDNGQIDEFGNNTFPPFHPVIYAGSMLATIACLSLVILLRRGQGQTLALFDFLLAALAFTVASPIAWEHHYGILLPIFAVLACVLIMSRPGAFPVWLMAGLGIAFLSAAVPLEIFRQAPGILNLLTFHLFIAALFILFTLWRLTDTRFAGSNALPPSAGEAS